jgi:hypothetical protein
VVKAGVLTSQLPEAMELCEDWSALFADWLKSGHHTHQAAPERTADAAPVRWGPRRGDDEPGAIVGGLKIRAMVSMALS